ncbi:MAG: hypothetical protein WBA86_12215 [Nodosilinea sp.]
MLIPPSCILKHTSLTVLCIFGVAVFSTPAAANTTLDLQDEVLGRGISSEDVDNAMRNRPVSTFPESEFPYYAPVNGCSNPIPVNWNEVFEGACNIHDRCYQTPGKTKSSCDAAMMEEMLNICEFAPSSIHDLYCRGIAEFFNLAVVESAQAHRAYDQAQSQQNAYISTVYNWLNDISDIVCTNSNIVTDILVNPKDRIIIRANGTVVLGAFAGAGSPWGINGFQIFNYFAGVRHGLLLGRIRQAGMGGLEGYFPVGEGWNGGREIILNEQGFLEFLVNDNNPQDNRGEFCIEVINLGPET